MHWKRIVVAVAVACVAFPASGNWNRAYAEAGYEGDGGSCYILGSPSNDFFCTEWDEYDITSDNDGAGSSGGGGGGPDKVCGRFTRALCGGTNTHRVYIKTCSEWTVTSVNGSISVVPTKPIGLGLGYTAECSGWTEVTKETTTPNRWNQ